MATKRVYANRSDLATLAAGAYSGDWSGGGWLYKGLSWTVHGENRNLKPGHCFYVAGDTLAAAQAAAALITARYP